MKAKIVYISHGGGPLPLMGDPSHQEMVAFLHKLGKELPKPDEILVISAHWEQKQATVLSNANPPVLYDYYGFPPETYQYSYPAPGATNLASEIMKMLQDKGIPCLEDGKRGYDHGTYVPLMLMYPDSDIPCTQLSLLSSLSEEAHIALGEALEGLQDRNVLIIGSGFSFHNLRAFGPAAHDGLNDAFQDYLSNACTSNDWKNKLLSWERAAGARYCHPRSDHLLPLLVTNGIAGKPGTIIFDDSILGKRCLGILWE